jgi:Fic family protein
LKYLTVKEIAEKWGLSERRVRKLCDDHRLAGAERTGWIWLVPESAERPVDGRILRHKLRQKEGMKMAGMDFTAIDRKRKEFDKFRPLPKHTLHSLHENTLLEWTFNSNAIEGNTLTLSETKVVFEGLTIGGKSMQEHLEVLNHREAILFLEELVRAGAALSEWEIKQVHALILKGIDPENAGVYRRENVIISGAKHRPPGHLLVKEAMERMVALYNGAWQKLHPVERAALLHSKLVEIHPFIDGNGRTARLLLNFELMKSGYPPAIIRQEERPAYYDSLDLAHTTGDYCDFIRLVAGAVAAALDLWLSVVADK